MARGQNPSLTSEYILQDDRDAPPEDQSVFLIRCLDAETRSRIQDNAISMEAEDVSELENGAPGGMKMNSNTGRTEMLALLNGLVDIQNYEFPAEQTEDGYQWHELEWPANGSRSEKKEALDKIAPQHRTELANQITEASFMTEGEVKN